MERIFSDSPVPRYIQLANVIRERIVREVLQPGDKIESLEQFMADFEVSRVTVRKAVQMLSGEGLLSAERGRGTFVTKTASRGKQLHMQTSFDELVDMYRHDKPDPESMVISDKQPVLTDNDGSAAARYVHMRRVHVRGGERYCVISIYIDEGVYQLAPERFRDEVVLPILTSLPAVEVSSGRQILEISIADVEIARLLGVSVNAPVANVRRVLNAPDGTVVYLAEVTYRSDYIHLEMDLEL